MRVQRFVARDAATPEVRSRPARWPAPVRLTSVRLNDFAKLVRYCPRRSVRERNERFLGANCQRGCVIFYVAIVSFVLVIVPLLAMGLLFIIGWKFPEVRRRGLHQLSQPFALRGARANGYELRQRRRTLEDEVIRRFGPPDPPTPSHD